MGREGEDEVLARRDRRADVEVYRHVRAHDAAVEQVRLGGVPGQRGRLAEDLPGEFPVPCEVLDPAVLLLDEFGQFVGRQVPDGEDGGADDGGSADESTDSDGGGGDGDEDATEPTAETVSSPTGEAALSIVSGAFPDGESIPPEYTCSGTGRSPPLTVAVPDGPETLALIADDPDAPREEPFVHWLVWNVPADLTEWPVGVSTGERAPELEDAPQGQHSGGDLGYFPPCPPEGDGPHRYRFTVHAVDTTLDLDPGADRAALESVLEGNVLARDRLGGTFERD